MRRRGNTRWWCLTCICLLAACTSKPPPGPPTPGPGACTPTTCAAQGKNCGELQDGCGATLQCGVCPDGATCGGGGAANVCGTAACVPTTCEKLGFNCGQAPDGCGATLSCGTCADGATCGGDGKANTCGKPGCQPTTCQAKGANCGAIPDGCGGKLDCGGCSEGKGCGAAGVPNVCGNPPMGGPGPWPLDNVTYGAAQGILEQPVVGTTTDEAQNLWVATHSALYLLKPGAARFKRYAAADGLHLPGNPASYCDSNFGGGDKSCPIYGAAADPGISELVGGGFNEVFVGYYGYDEGPADWSDPNRHSGKLDRVRLKEDGTLQVDRFDLTSVNHGAQYWHNRTIMRMIYDHFTHKHELYVGTNHGVDRLLPDKYRPPNPGEWFDLPNMEYMGDHLHARVCFHAPCDDTESNQRMGDWRGLGLAANGDLWTAGRWTAGLIKWDPDVVRWFMRPGDQAFVKAFGDPYPREANDEGFINEPVFRVAEEGDPVNLSAVAVTPDGKVWFASGAYYGGDVSYGVAAWTGRSFTLYHPMNDLGMAEYNVRDLVALPDGRLVLAGPNTGLVFWNPATGEKKVMRAGQGIPDDNVTRLELDTMVSPPALHVSTRTGATVLRKLP